MAIKFIIIKFHESLAFVFYNGSDLYSNAWGMGRGWYILGLKYFKVLWGHSEMDISGLFKSFDFSIS